MTRCNQLVHAVVRWPIARGAAQAVLVIAALTTVLGHPAHAQRQPGARRPTSGAAMDTAMSMNKKSGPRHEHGMSAMMQAPLGIPDSRIGSGTSWVPDASPMYANHQMWHEWTLMTHGAAFGQYDDQGSRRGSSQLGVINWGMLMAMRPVDGGMLNLTAMASLEPLTIGSRGYPLLLQTGESYQRQPLHDRQHPHDLFMQLAATYDHQVASNLAFEFYAAPVGEPALGPVTYMHRASAMNDPLAPIGHHWQDATHISFGVATAGLYSRLWKLEGSWFNGVEPDENRWNFDFGRFDSFSGRLTVNPTASVSVAGWYGFLPHPERLHPEESVHRYGASAMYVTRGIGSGAWASTVLWSANHRFGQTENSVLAESNLEIGEKSSVFGRVEYVRKNDEDLVLGPAFPPNREFNINSLVAGYVREIASIRGGSVGLGARGSINFVPSALEPFYGTRTPAGIDVYLRLRPNRMKSDAMPNMNKKMDSAPRMPGMKMPDTGEPNSP